MASPKIKIKRTAVAGKVPTIAQLELGELAINTTDGKLFLKKSLNSVESIIDVGAATTLAGNNGEFQFNDNGSYGASPNLTYDGFNITATDLKLVGTLTANGSTGASGYVLSSTGAGVQWVQLPGLQLFPTGDYNSGADPLDPLAITTDAFGVSTIPSWDTMGPEGTIYIVDLGSV
jgi:hypothetical protein